MENTALKMFTDTVKYEGSHIFVKPLCDFFGINYDNQVSKIKNTPELALQTGKNRCETLFGDTRHHFSLTKTGFLIWILSINHSTVRTDLQQNFIQYRSLIAEFLFGSIEEHELISRLNAELQNYRKQYSELGNIIRSTEKQLKEALNQRYQYRLEFTPKNQLQ